MHRCLSKIRNAGTVFLGEHSPESAGDYAAGPSHVLPTSGTARCAAGLSARFRQGDRDPGIVASSPAGTGARHHDAGARRRIGGARARRGGSFCQLTQ